MIEQMHEKTKGPVFKIIVFLIAISFVLAGVGGGMMLHSDDSAVKVNGEKISQHTFVQAKNREQRQRSEQEGEFFTNQLDNPVYMQAFNNVIFDQLINEELLRQYIEELKLKISIEQIQSHIVNMPIFHQNGKFDNALYLQTLRNNGINADYYASIVERGMAMSQLQEGIVGSHFSVPAQQALLAKLLLQKRHIRLATYPLSAEIAAQHATEEEIHAFYTSHKERFKSPEKFKVDYIRFTRQAVESKIDVSPAQIETYYQTNKASYVTEAQSQLAHIQVANENEANEILQALQKGEDFAKLAQAHSQDKGSAAKGGDLGWAKAGTYPKAFEDAAAVLNVGEHSQAVKIDGAFHIIKVLNRKAEKNIPLEQVKAQIAQTIRAELAQSEYANTAREMAKQAYQNGDLSEMAKLGNIRVQSTAVFSVDNIPAELNDEKIVKTLFNGEFRRKGEISEGIELGEGMAAQTLFLRVSQYIPESEKTLDEAKEQVREAVKLEKAHTALQTKVEREFAALQSGENLSVPFNTQQTWVFAQAQLQHPQLANVVFAMPKPIDKSSYQSMQAPNGDMLILALDKVEDGAESEFASIAAQIEHREQAILLNEVLQDRRQRAKIEFNQDFVEQQQRTH